MRVSQFALNTLKETPADAEIISHQLMLRAGLIRKLAGGLYTWTPLGLRTLRKVEAIIREEMNAAGALEVLMPTVQPAELWQESNRWDLFGDQLLRFQDRHERDFCYGPTHEEVIVDYARQELKSYKQLPVNYYQIQLKFRDEIRPRFGVMRAREFIMKDAYSFHADQASLDETYSAMYQAYTRIFTRLGLNFRAVWADSGAIGGAKSQEFHVLADSGEDAIVYSDQSDYAANVEMAPLPEPETIWPPTDVADQAVKVATPNVKSIEQVCQALSVTADQTIKTLLVKGSETTAVALVVRGDHALNDVKAEKLPWVASPTTLLDEAACREVTGAGPGSIGPLGLTIPVVVDYAATLLASFVCGANEEGYHLQHATWQAAQLPAQHTSADLRQAMAGDPSPDGCGQLQEVRGIEVGHIFQLGDKYTRALQTSVLDADGRALVPQMGCYGIGVSRIVAAAIEQHHDQSGIVWPAAMAPFSIAIVTINGHKSAKVRQTAETLYRDLQKAGVDVLYDDRDLRPGVKFKDMELIGIPHRITIGEKALAQGEVEYQNRAQNNDKAVKKNIAVDELMFALTELAGGL